MTDNAGRPPGADDEDARGEPPAPPARSPLAPWPPSDEPAPRVADPAPPADPEPPAEPPTFTELISQPADPVNPAPPSPLIEPVLPPPALQPPPALIHPPSIPETQALVQPAGPPVPRVEDIPTQAMPVMNEPAPTEAMPAAEVPSDAATELMRGTPPPGVGDAPIGGDVDGDALEAVFGEQNFREYEPTPLLAPPPPAASAAPNAAPFGGVTPAGATASSGTAAAPGTAAEPGHAPRASGLDRTQRTLLWVAGSLAAILVLIGLFFLGTRIPEWTAAEPEPEPTVEPIPEPEPEPEPDPLEGVPDGVPLPAGEWEWSLLRGGECLEPWVSPWEEQFTVVDCAEPHAAQLILRQEFPEAPEEYPGPEALAAPLSLICSSPDVLDFGQAAAYDDVQIQTAYPVTAEEWADGYRDFFCFISRAGGGPLEGSLSLVAPGTGE